MDKQYDKEMVISLKRIEQADLIQGKSILLFGHCKATEDLIDLLINNGYIPMAILDNNKNKYGKFYRNIPIVAPEEILKHESENVIVCIVARAYAAMVKQLRQLGYEGIVKKLVDYNSYAEYSLSEQTIKSMEERLRRGKVLLDQLDEKYCGYFKILCPFSALGDIFFMRTYLPYFLENRNISKYVICVIGRACAKVVSLFGSDPVEVFLQKDMDELIQASIYWNRQDFFISHQDRPYVVSLHRALYQRCIPLENMYKCGVYGLPLETKPIYPKQFNQYRNLDKIKSGKTVILSPYAKSVPAISERVWKEIVDSYKELGFDCYTNVIGDEIPLEGTEPISPDITEINSLIEKAGIFIGIRSGLCDVVTYAKCKKFALYPDYNYSDTRWKAIDIYRLEGWTNLLVDEGFKWKIY